MTIYEFINEDEFLGKDISVYIDNEGAENLIDEIIENDEDIYSDFEEVLEENETVIVSKVYSNEGIEWFVDPISYGKGQVYNETEIAFIMEDLLEEIDFNRVDCDEVVVLSGQDNEEIEVDYLDELLEEMTGDTIREIEDDGCPHCTIKEQLRIMYNIAREEALEEVQDLIREIN